MKKRIVVSNPKQFPNTSPADVLAEVGIIKINESEMMSRNPGLSSNPELSDEEFSVHIDDAAVDNVLQTLNDKGYDARLAP